MSNTKPNQALQVQNTDRQLITNKEVQSASRQLALAGQVSKQLILNDERQRWVALLVNSDLGVVTFLSQRFSLSLDLLERFADRWDWEALSKNKSLPWSLALLERFADRWSWLVITLSRSAPTPVLTEQDIDKIMSKIKKFN